MANLVYKRVSHDQRSTDRQNLVLAEAQIEDPGTSSRLHHPRTGEPHAAVRFMVQTLAARGEPQRDLSVMAVLGR
jgi:hypothetical protein